jgi:hypothetical protein
MNFVTHSLEELVQIHTNDIGNKEPAKTRRICKMFIEESIETNNNDYWEKNKLKKYLLNLFSHKLMMF